MAGPEAPARSPPSGLRRLSPACAALRTWGGALWLALSAAPALASPWIAPREEIAWIGYSEGADSRVIETGASAEQGFAGDRASVIVETWSRDASDERRLRGGVGLKLSLHRGPHWAVAVQGGGLFVDGAEKGVPDPDSGGPRCVGAGGEGRVMVGRAPRAAGRGPFVTVEIASRAQGGCASALVDATIGYEIEHKWILLAQAFQDRGLHGSETLNVQVSAVRLRRMRGLQIGLRARLDGAEPEPAVIIGLWRRDRRGQ